MALTKARPPVTDISLMSKGTTSVTIPTAGADIDVVVAGVTVMTIGSTTVLVDPAITLDSSLLTGESYTMATTSGAGATLRTTATQAELETTSAHPLVLGANNIDAITVGTDGRATLGVEGTAIGHLVTKAYIDNITAGVVAEADFGTTQATTGHISIPTTTGINVIINWGTNVSVGDGSITTKTFDLAFPNAFFVGVASPTTSANFDGTLAVINGGLTTLQVQSSLDKSASFNYIAIGY